MQRAPVTLHQKMVRFPIGGALAMATAPVGADAVGRGSTEGLDSKPSQKMKFGG